MPKYICLRNCFVFDFLHYAGRTYDIPEGKPVSPKNFQLAEDVKPQPVTEPLKEEVKEMPPEPETEPTKTIPKGFYLCSKCEAIHRETSKLGKRHLKYKK